MLGNGREDDTEYRIQLQSCANAAIYNALDPSSSAI